MLLKNIILISVLISNFHRACSMEQALAILHDKQTSCSTNPDGSLILEDSDEMKLIEQAIKQYPEMLEKIESNLKDIKLKSKSLNFDNKIKKDFEESCSVADKCIELAKKRRAVLNRVHDGDAMGIAKTAYIISAGYGALGFMSFGKT